jgi:class 3 adenylate cyclase
VRLRAKQSLALIALAVIPLAIVTLVLVRVNLARLEISAKEYRLAVADAVARHVRSRVRQAETELRAIGAALAQTDAQPADRLATARALLLGSRHVDQVALYDARGEHVETLRSNRPGLDARRPDRLDEATRGLAVATGTCHGEAVTAGAEGLALPLVVPLFAGERRVLYGYLWTTLRLRDLGAAVGRISRRRFGGESHRVFLVDGKLRIVAHGDRAQLGRSAARRGLLRDLRGPAAALRRDFAVSAEYTVRGEAVLGVLTALPELGWGVVVEQPRAEAYAAVRLTWQTALAVGGACVLLALGLGLWLGRRLAAPVLAVARAARAVAGGDFQQRVQVSTRDEVGEMAGAFNAMAADLDGYEKRVVEETRIRTDLGRYLSAEVVEGIIHRTIELELGGERREVTVLFADVVAFTPLTEAHPPEQVVATLNELFTILTEIVFRHGGIVDKFIGDSVMAVFGAPRAVPDSAVAAARAAEEMLAWLETGNVRWRKQLGRDLELAIGMNTGEVVAGNLGSERRMEYTVIGDVVNTAARLETLARPGQVLMTEATQRRLGEAFEVEPLGEHALPGRKKPLVIYALVTT